LYWNYFDISICIISSYVYTLLAAFGYNPENSPLMNAMFWFDFYFFMRILKGFFTDYLPLGETFPEKNLLKIVLRYLKNDFPLEIILWFPTQRLLPNINENFKLLLLIKIYRIQQSM
jgi:hypothetical protein